jgi:hypothetical protein
MADTDFIWNEVSTMFSPEAGAIKVLAFPLIPGRIVQLADRVIQETFALIPLQLRALSFII